MGKVIRHKHADIDYGFAEALTTYLIGVKVYYGDIWVNILFRKMSPVQQGRPKKTQEFEFSSPKEDKWL